MEAEKMRVCWFCGGKALPDTLLCENCVAEVDMQTAMKYKRMARLLDLLELNGEMSVKDITLELKVTDSTVRKYLKELEKRGMVRMKKKLASNWITIVEVVRC
jgi:DNA-binding MarR family transcriptional regulator